MPLMAIELTEAIAQATKMPLMASDWRTEVIANGKYWQFRKGSGDKRRSAYGGKFSDLSPTRQAEYKKRTTRR